MDPLPTFLVAHGGDRLLTVSFAPSDWAPGQITRLARHLAPTLEVFLRRPITGFLINAATEAVQDRLLDLSHTGLLTLEPDGWRIVGSDDLN